MKTFASLLSLILLGSLPTLGDEDVDRLIEEYRKVERTAARYPAQKLAKAAGTGDVKALKRLLDSGVPVSLRIPHDGDWKGIPPWDEAIHHAVREGQVEATRFLLGRGARVNARNSSEGTPLHMAPTTRIADLLLAHGADVSAQDDIEARPIHSVTGGAISPQEALALSRLLIRHGADPLARDIDGRQPLHNAAAESTAEVVAFFLRQGAKPTSRAVSKRDIDWNGWQPLHFAAAHDRDRSNDAEISRLLIRKGADVNAVTPDGESPLHFSTGAPVTRLLLENGARVNIRDTGILKQTPLHHFAVTGELESVKLMLQYGANVNAPDGSGETPLDQAAFWGRQDVVSLLLKNGAKPTSKTLAQAEQSKKASIIRLIKTRLNLRSMRPPHRL